MISEDAGCSPAMSAAGFADAEGKATGNATGTSDALPVAAQLEMIRALMPDAKAIGILYTTSEVNSLSTIETYKSLAGDYGFEIVESGVSTSADIPLALDALSEDGVIEAYEYGDRVLATQWHPERLLDEGMLPIWQWFIRRCNAKKEGDSL